MFQNGTFLLQGKTQTETTGGKKEIDYRKRHECCELLFTFLLLTIIKGRHTDIDFGSKWLIQEEGSCMDSIFI